MTTIQDPDSVANPASGNPGPEGLCSPLAVGLASVVCGPIAAFWFLSYNDARLGKRADGLYMVVIGGLWTFINLVSPYVIPPADAWGAPNLLFWAFLFINFALPVGLTYALHGQAYKDQCQRRAAGASRSDMIKRAVFGWFVYMGIWLGALALFEAAAGNKPVPSEQSPWEQ